MSSEVEASEMKLRKVTIDYSDFDYLGIQEEYMYVVLNLHRADGSRLIVLETRPTHKELISEIVMDDE